MLEILAVIVFSSITLFFGFYILYYAICRQAIWKKPERLIKGFSPENLPTVSIIVPIYNENRVIQAKMENLQSLNYPLDKFEVVFVDGGSVDGTIETIKCLLRDSKLSTKLVLQGSRKGFNSAVIEGFRKTTGEIIFITGAEAEYQRDSLNLIIRHFADQKVAAVTGRQEIKNVQDGLSPKIELAYRSLYDFIREAESYIDSPFDIKGEISAARRSIVRQLVENPRMLSKGCIDACFSFQARIKGYKTVYEPEAIYYELSPRSIKDSFKQQIRRAATLIQNMLVFKSMMLRRTYGAFGMLIMPAHFLMLLILPYVFLVASVGVVALAVLYPLNYEFALIATTGTIILIFSKRFQAFVKAQVALIIASLNLFKGVETQKFERLESIRPEK